MASARNVGAVMRAEERERRRLAARLHDDAVQVMYASVMQIRTAAERASDPQVAALCHDLAAKMEESAERLRKVMADLQPPWFHRQGLAEVLRAALDRAGREGGFAVSMEDRLDRQPAPEQSAVIYRIVQEALANAVRHSCAEHVDVGLAAERGGVRVRVSDDGVGCRADRLATGAEQLGLASMQERAEMAGGWWRVDSDAGQGTTVEFWIPLDHDGTAAVDPSTAWRVGT